MKTVMVLGGTGFVGTALCTLLSAQGWQLRVPTRASAAPAAPAQVPGQTLLALDVHDEAALTQALAGCDAVVNLVAILHGTPTAFEQVHVALPKKIARACVQAGVHQLVQVSALGADAAQPDAPPSLYLRSKSRGEAVLRQAAAQFALSVHCLRPSVIFGAGDKFLNVFAQLQMRLPFIPLAGAQARFQPVWVEDVAQAVLRCLQAPKDVPTLLEACGPEVYTLRELVALSGRLSRGRERPIVPLPDALARLQAALMERLPGETLMSRDNLDSMKVDNVASGQCADLRTLGIVPAALPPVAEQYLRRSYSVKTR